MTIAEIHGKLPSREASEDVLTSDVFGTFSYLEPQKGLIPFLQHAKNIEGSSLLFEETIDVTDAEYFFWPKTKRLRREPDLLLLVTVQGDRKVALNVECKYFSGKSNRDDEESPLQGDQLAEQYVELLENQLVLPEDALMMLKAAGENKYLLYVTSHYECPIADLQESITRLVKVGYDENELKRRIFWLSWRDLRDILVQLLKGETVGRYERRQLQDLLTLVERKRLVPFSGVHAEKSKGLHAEACSFWNTSQTQGNQFFSFDLSTVRNLETTFWEGR